MSIRDVNSIQDQALAAFERVPQSEAASWAQVIAQCEIAQQLAGINEKLESIDGRLEKVYVSSDENFDLQDIAKKLASIAAILRDK